MTLDIQSSFLSWDSSVTPPKLAVQGNWTLANYVALRHDLARFRTAGMDEATLRKAYIEFSSLKALDTAGASQLLELLGTTLTAELSKSSASLSAERRALLQTISDSKSTPTDDTVVVTSSTKEVLAHIGSSVEGIWRQVVALLGFMGLTLEALARAMLRPTGWRITSVVALIQETGLNAVPIIVLLTFMVGAVVAFLGATILADFGASVYTVNLVAFSFLREFAVLLTAILMAGRTASAFTAQIGSMKANEEIDAIRMMGLSPIDLLVLPRVVAMLISMPLLTFVGMISGIAGGAMVCALALDIPPVMFLTLMHQDIELRHFIVGMIKAPLFAYVIAIIGCLEGFKVSGSAQSVGEHTTSAVVQSIFIVIMLDALAALFFMEMGW
ncbi:ABC transporter permease [Candidimonas sp. SYP-B2681]|uniref:MlaE family ABC transporter permease n=1 Tax=Candidimonas sp. SYP-B2681 TaxID=2497686 RepID=UPI0018F39EC3|nr:ABC transporter permease [Candidimonas sp. SYP-B2681]